MKLIKELWNYREMIISLVKRDLKGRYKGSVMGFLWTMINPLLQLAVYTFVFSVIMPSGVDRFYLFLFVALVPWLFFSTCLSTGTTVIFAQQEMVKKIYFPRQILPISFTISQFVNMLLSFVVIFIVLIFSGIKFNFKALACLPIIMLVQFILCLGITFVVSALTVYLRDLEYILSIISMAWMYLTPILYPIENVPEAYRGICYINPMTSIIVAYRDILYSSKVPEMGTLMIAVFMGILLLVIGLVSFERLQRHFAEEL
ncbi:ABC transporter permease [Blautia sp. HCP3S3_H10_1]|uniref:ABC transporter permease n=1 Tax=unclassified Blautia TaxID=2648079 RepID=UPI003F8EED2D